MLNVSRDQMVAAFEELVLENQVQTAMDLLVSADPADQLLIVANGSPVLLHRLFQGLDAEDQLEVTRRLADGARNALHQILAASPSFAEEAGETPANGAEYLDARELEALFTPQPDAVVEEDTASVRSVPTVAERQDFALIDGRLRESDASLSNVTVYSNPSGPAQLQLLESLNIDEHTLASVLDPDEISRLEYDPDDELTFIVWKRPRREETEHPELLELSSLGLFLQPDHLTIIAADELPLLRAGDRAASLQDVLLRIMAATVNEFLVELKTVKRTSRAVQTELSRSIENRQLLKMFNLSEGLVYHINAIDANGGVLRRLRAIAGRLGFDELDMDLLEDIIIDNTQCSRQGQVFSTVLAGMLDARGNLINNNMNVLLKNLTIVNVIFLPLGVITGIGGMSEFSLMLDDHAVDWWLGYPVFTIGLAAFGFALWVLVRSFVNRAWQQ
jgi:magnesium transporter